MMNLTPSTAETSELTAIDALLRHLPDEVGPWRAYLRVISGRQG